MNEELEIVYDTVKEKNNKALEHLKYELKKVRAGKAHPSMLDSVMVDYYGSPTPISQVANVNTMDARTITVQPWEKPLLNDIMRGIINANLGLAPQNNGETLIISIPPLTEERRQELAKQIKVYGENAKVTIRNSRKDANDDIKSLKNDGLSEDMAKDAEAEVQNLTNSFSSKVDDLLAAKEKDLMTV